jgi:hypothetical protein
MFLGTILLLSGSLFATGCHAPDLSSMKSSTQKLAIGIVGTQELMNTTEFQTYVSKVFQDSGVAFDLRPVSDLSQARESLAALAGKQSIDLVLADTKYSQAVKDLAKAYGQTKIALIGADDAQINLDNIRQVSLNKEFQTFTAGYLAASVNPKQPVGVIVQTGKPTSSSEWKGLLEGIHYAGSSLSPVVVTLDDVMAANGLLKLQSSLPNIYLLLDSVTEEQLARLHASGKRLFAMHDLPKLYPSVIARPKPIFAEGVQEEIQALLNNSWQGKTTVFLKGPAYFDILHPEVLPGAIERMKNVEDGLNNRTLRPEDYVKPPVDQTNSKPF